MSSLVPSEVSLLQKFSVNKILENFSYDLIFPMDLPTDPGSAEKRSQLLPLRTSFGFEEINHFEDSTSTTPSSLQSDYSPFPGTGGNVAARTNLASQNNWYSSRPNISQPDHFLENSQAFSPPPKRYLSDSNLANYQFGSATGDTSPTEPSLYSSNQAMSSPCKGDRINGNHNSSALDYEEPFHTRSSYNLNHYGNSFGNNAPQKVDKGTMYSSDILNNLLALNSSNSPDSYASNMKELEQTMRLLQTQHQHQHQLQQQQSGAGNYSECRPKQHHNHFRSSSSHSHSPSHNYSRQSSGCGDERMEYLRQTSFNGTGGLTPKYSSHASSGTTNTSGGSRSNFSSCSSIDNSGRMGTGTAADTSSNAVRTWNGVIPTRTSKAVTYSQKVFLGGIPWETSEETLKHIFGRFGPLRVEWPGKDPNFSTKPKGCVYIIFENEKQVRELLAACQIVRDRHVAVDDGKFFYKFPWKNMKTKNVEVIPWNIADSNYVSSSQILDPSKTIFVGALHGKLTAEGLALIMNDLFDGVVYAGIDTDKHKYPLGAGRVTFNNPQSYMKAIQTAYLMIKTPIFMKKVQIDPYLEDNLCSTCSIHHGPYYCRELCCFRYFCRVCWQVQHNDVQRAHHRPLTRNSKSQSVVFND